jgi:translation initiation factor 6 (eIF-6)
MPCSLRRFCNCLALSMSVKTPNCTSKALGACRAGAEAAVLAGESTVAVDMAGRTRLLAALGLKASTLSPPVVSAMLGLAGDFCTGFTAGSEPGTGGGGGSFGASGVVGNSAGAGVGAGTSASWLDRLDCVAIGAGVAGSAAVLPLPR